jgi:chorismate mutase/prephenate dehydratase
VDRIDDQILKWLAARSRVARDIGRVKANRGEEVISLERERQVLERVAAANPGPLPVEGLQEIYTSIINNCRLLQRRLTVSFFGPEATYTHQAAVKQFGRTADLQAAKNITDVFDDVEKGRADYGVVPVENSTEGMVTHTLDMFAESDLVICAEREDPIAHCLLAAGDAKKFKAVYSHPQALAQCRKWLESHLPGVPVHEAASTADAAAQAALHAGVAAVASPLASELYKLRVVAAGIQDARDNRTRFLVIGKKLAPPSGPGRDKTSLLVSIKDRVGALHDLLGIFKTSGLNLTKIESRPTKKRAWEYVFFIDVLGHVAEPRLRRALERLRRDTAGVKLLGSYRRAD